jgi:hypothetical protein
MTSGCEAGHPLPFPIVSELFVEEFSHGDVIMSRGPCLEPYLIQVIPNVQTLAQISSVVYGPFKEMWTKQMFGKYCDGLLPRSFNETSFNETSFLTTQKNLSFALRSDKHSLEKITLSRAGIFKKKRGRNVRGFYTFVFFGAASCHTIAT